MGVFFYAPLLPLLGEVPERSEGKGVSGTPSVAQGQRASSPIKGSQEAGRPKGADEKQIQRNKQKTLAKQVSFLESGGYLSSRAVRPSTLGVRELNFCVRDGNRWILSAIVTGMVYKRPLGRLYRLCR